MIRLASLASCAARKTCIRGGLRRECRFGLSMSNLSLPSKPARKIMPERSHLMRSCCDLRPIGEAIPTSNSRSEWMEGIHSPPWSAWLRRLRLLVFLQVPSESDAAFSTAFVGLRVMEDFRFYKLQRHRF